MWTSGPEKVEQNQNCSICPNHTKKKRIMLTRKQKQDLTEVQNICFRWYAGLWVVGVCEQTDFLSHAHSEWCISFHVNRYRSSLQPVSHPQHHPADAGRLVCRRRTRLQHQEQHPAQRRNPLRGSRWVHSSIHPSTHMSIRHLIHLCTSASIHPSSLNPSLKHAFIHPPKHPSIFDKHPSFSPQSIHTSIQVTIHHSIISLSAVVNLCR